MKKLIHFIVLFILLAITAFAQQDEKPNPNIKEIIFVFKTHFDNGYTDMAESVINKYSTTMMEQALTTLEKSRNLPREKQFVWTMPSWPLTQILQRCTPEIKPKVEAAIRDGWFVYHGLPFTFETEAADPEALVRSLSFSANLSRKFNLPLPRDAKLTDVPSHSWFLPTLLSNAGIKILHIGCNAVSSSPDVPLIFWWQGPDDSKLMTIYWGKNYGTSLVPDETWKFKTWLAIIHTGDNQGPPAPEDVEKVLIKTHELAPNAKLRIGRISDFYDALMKENPDLPVVRGDMPDTWIHGYMSMPREMKSVRSLQKDIYSFELLNTLLNNWTDRNVDVSQFAAAATEGALLLDEHTFGMAMSHGHSGDWYFGNEFHEKRAEGTFRDLEASWKEKGDRVYQAEKILLPAFEREMKRLSSSVNVLGQRIVIYNPLPWIRSGIVTVQQETKIEALQELRTGEIVLVHNKGNVLRFVAKNVPSSGYTTYVPVPAPKTADVKSPAADEKANIIENEFFRIKIDPDKGAIVSVIDKKTGREMVDQNSPYGFGQYMYERFSKKETNEYIDAYLKVRLSWGISEFGRPNLDETPYNRVNGGKATVKYSSDDISVKAFLHFTRETGNPHNYSLSYTLYKDLPFIEINWFIDGKQADPWPEAGWISFPFKIDNPQFKVGRLGAVIDPSKDIVKGSDFDFYLINSGIALLDNQKNGFSICTPDAPGISLDRPGLWKYSGYFIPQKPNVFVNLYNNQWSTNFTEWIEGSWSAKMYIWSFQDYKNEQSLISPSEEFRSPLKATMISGRPGTLPAYKEGIRLSKRGVLITSFGPNVFGGGTVLRLWEQAGESGKCKVTLPAGISFTNAIPVNLRGEKAGNPIVIKDSSFEIEIGAYKPASFLLEM
jgi:alpha-mannosidase